MAYDDSMGEISSSPGIVVAVGGLSGSGKSTLSKALERLIGDVRPAARVNTDIVRKELWGIPPHEKLPDAAYLSEFSNKTHGEFHRRVIEHAQAGRVVLADSVFANEYGRAGIEAQARAAGLGFHGLWVDVPPDILRARVRGRTGDVSDADVRVLDLQLTFNLGQNNWHKIDGSGNEGAVLSQALSYLRREGLLSPPDAPRKGFGFFFPERK